jgi:protein TonB
MPDQSEPKFPSSEKAPSGDAPLPGRQESSGEREPESDLAHLAGMFAAHGGGLFSAQFSANLDLEMTLNEVVEQICLTTGASGAAIDLMSEGDLVCRARRGTVAAAVGDKLDLWTGLVAECVRTRQIQRRDDVSNNVVNDSRESDPRQNDPRQNDLQQNDLRENDSKGEAQALQPWVIRSVLIFPLLQDGQLLGVLESFSPRPRAFGERDENTLEALARRVLEHLKPVAGLSLTGPSAPVLPVPGLTNSPSPAADKREELKQAAAVELPPEPQPAAVSAKEIEFPLPRPDPILAETGEELSEDPIAAQAESRSRWTAFDYVTLALGVIVLGCAVFLATLVELRGRHKAAGGVHSAAEARVAQPPEGADVGGGGRVSQESPAALAARVDGKNEPSAATATPPGESSGKAPEPGSLSVYQNGKEVFRLPSGTSAGDIEGTAGSEVQPASSLDRQGLDRQGIDRQEPEGQGVDREGILQLSARAAENILLYRTEPEYPEAARAQGIQGAVVLEVRIGGDGGVQEARLVSGPPLLADAAMAAVKEWRFRPRFSHGRRVEMQTTVTLNFRLP